MTGGNDIQTSTARPMIQSAQPPWYPAIRASALPRAAERRRAQGREQRHAHRHPRAENEARENIAAEAVGAERIAPIPVGRPGRWRQRAQQILIPRIVRRQDRGKDRHQQQHDHERPAHLHARFAKAATKRGAEPDHVRASFGLSPR